MRHELDPDRSMVTVHGSSTIHPITTGAPVTGWVDLTLDRDGRLEPGAPVDAAVEVALGTMRSGNPLIDREAVRRLHLRRHPTVTGRLAALSTPDDGALAGSGTLDFHGVRRPLEGILRVTPGPDGGLAIEGSATIDVTDFGVQPPSLLLIKVHPEVRLTMTAIAFPPRHQP